MQCSADTVPAPRGAIERRQRVDGELTEKWPVDLLNAVLALQPGVVASATGNALEIRGGRDNESATYVDGVPITGGIRPSTITGIGLAAVGGASKVAISVQNHRLVVGTNERTRDTLTDSGSVAEFVHTKKGNLPTEDDADGPG